MPTRKCANCPRLIVVPVRGGRRYCPECADVMRAARREQVQKGKLERQESMVLARNVIHEDATIFDCERIILAWMRGD